MCADELQSPRVAVPQERKVRSLSRDELRAVVDEWTTVLKELESPPERVLSAVKTLVKATLATDGLRSADVRDRSALIEEASTWCIRTYYDPSDGRRQTTGTRNSVALRSVSRQLLLKFLVMRPEFPCDVLASRLNVRAYELPAFASGAQLMPHAVQESLAALVLEEEPRLAPLAKRLRLQAQAARRYEAGEVIRHLTSPARLR